MDFDDLDFDGADAGTTSGCLVFFVLIATLVYYFGFKRHQPNNTPELNPDQDSCVITLNNGVKIKQCTVITPDNKKH